MRAQVISDLRKAGVSLAQLADAAARLHSDPEAVMTGSWVLVNGSVTIVDGPDDVIEAVSRESTTLVYNTAHALDAVGSALSA